MSEARSVVLLQKFLSPSKKNVFYNRTKVKRVKDVLIFSRRICCCSNYIPILMSLKIFATEPQWVPSVDEIIFAKLRLRQR